jgi:hypothetical protein
MHHQAFSIHLKNAHRGFSYKCTPNRAELFERGATYKSLSSGRWHCINEQPVLNLLRPIHSLETVDANRPGMQYHIAKEQRPQPHSCKSLQSRMCDVAWLSPHQPSSNHTAQITAMCSLKELCQQGDLVTTTLFRVQGLLNSEDKGPTILRNIIITCQWHGITSQETEPSATLRWDPQLSHYYIPIIRKVHPNYQDWEQCTGGRNTHDWKGHTPTM